jgi:hypothetical protein
MRGESSTGLAIRKGREAARGALGAERSKTFELLVRAGFVARGLTYGVIGGVAGALALGAGGQSGSANQQGALSLIAKAPLGKIVVGVAAVGLLMYALWKLSLAVLGQGPEGAGSKKLTDRISYAAGAIVYFGFFAVAARVLLGSPGNQSAQQRRTASGVLGWPAGPELVGAAGIAMIAISGYQVYCAIRGEFAKDSKTGKMGPGERKLFLTLGRIGLSARGIVFAIAGYFLVRTAIDFKPSGIGLDGALAKVHDQPYGTFLLALVAAGLLVFGDFSLFEARYRRL